MNFEPIRQAFQPLFGLERRETISRLLYAIIISVIVFDSVAVIQRLWGMEGSTSSTLLVLLAVLLLQFGLLFLLKQGQIETASITEVGLSWLLVTYQAWSSDGIRDVSIYIYVLISLWGVYLQTGEFPLFFRC